jgi:8-oxo-dGTP pyrophosphatase MutT (NUDIX family)
MSRPPRPPYPRLSFDPAAQPWQPAGQGLAALAPRWLEPDALRGLWAGISDWRRDEPPGYEERRFIGQGVPAAVLVPLVMRPAGLHVMLTQRAAHLNSHAGQISFPGGRIESGDAGPVAAALREAQEETGLPSGHVDVLGSMPSYTTSTGYSITPVVGLVRPDFTPAPDVSEVAEIFETPLSFLMNPAHHRLYQAALPDGKVRCYYAMPWNDYFIWGATASILRNLYRTLHSLQR